MLWLIFFGLVQDLELIIQEVAEMLTEKYTYAVMQDAVMLEFTKGCCFASVCHFLLL